MDRKILLKICDLNYKLIETMTDHLTTISPRWIGNSDPVTKQIYETATYCRQLRHQLPADLNTCNDEQWNIMHVWSLGLEKAMCVMEPFYRKMTGEQNQMGYCGLMNPPLNPMFHPMQSAYGINQPSFGAYGYMTPEPAPEPEAEPEVSEEELKFAAEAELKKSKELFEVVVRLETAKLSEANQSRLHAFTEALTICNDPGEKQRIYVKMLGLYRIDAKRDMATYLTNLAEGTIDPSKSNGKRGDETVWAHPELEWLEEYYIQLLMHFDGYNRSGAEKRLRFVESNFKASNPPIKNELEGAAPYAVPPTYLLILLCCDLLGLRHPEMAGVTL